MQFLTFPITHTAGDARRLPGSWRGGKGIAVVVRSKSELQTPATDDGAAVVSDTCICGGGPAEGRLRKVEIGSARSNDEPSHRRERLHYYPTHPTHQHQSHLGHCIVITMSFIGSASTSFSVLT